MIDVITYVYDKNQDGDLIDNIKSRLNKSQKAKHAIIYVISQIDELKNINMPSQKHKIIVTQNCARDFVREAIKYTNYLTYKFEDQERTIQNILNILDKV